MSNQIVHGQFFTDPTLAHLAAWFAKEHLPTNNNYTLFDPACGSGNLFLNNPHLGQPTVIACDLFPQLDNALELNFLDCSAEDYINKLPPIDKTKPLVVFVNPPYRGDGATKEKAPNYSIHKSIKDITGGAGAIERCNCFIAQLVNVIKHLDAVSTTLILITKCTLLGQRHTFKPTKEHLIKHFEFKDGFIVNSKEFFKCNGRFPIAVTVWKYNPSITNPNHIIKVRDLTHIKKKEIDTANYISRSSDPSPAALSSPSSLFENTKVVSFGVERDLFKIDIHQNQYGFVRSRRSSERIDFMRSRKQHERGDLLAGGLPLNDRRRTSTYKCTYGESTGSFIGFMDDLTPCRIKSPNNRSPCLCLFPTFYDVQRVRLFSGQPSCRGYVVPWFHLNPQFMHVKINRCFSGPHNCRSYHASDLSSAQKCFVWYALARTLQTFGYPMWADTEELWTPSLVTRVPRSSFEDKLLTPTTRLTDYAFAIGFGENECVETVFPENNPVEGAERITISNPLTSNNPSSFWNVCMKPCISDDIELVSKTEAVYFEWATRFNNKEFIDAGFEKPYFIEPGKLYPTAGLVQIKYYAETHNDTALLNLISIQKEELRKTKQAFYNYLVNDLNYFGDSL